MIHNPRYDSAMSMSMMLVVLISCLPPTSSLSPTCYDTKCRGTGEHSHTFIPCDNSVSTCTHNNTGYPECVSDTGPGQGATCGPESICRRDYVSGEAFCSLSDKTRDPCYDKTCVSSRDNATVPCDNSHNFCSRVEGMCVSTPWGGAGVTCPGEDCTWNQDGRAECDPASLTLYYVWGGVVGGAAFMSALLYFVIKLVQRSEKQRLASDEDRETEALLSSNSEHRRPIIETP